MANCCGGSSSVVIYGEDEVEVVGSGTPSDPYIIRSGVGLFMRGVDTPTVSTRVTGSGRQDDPYTVSASTEIALGDIIDVGAVDAPSVDDVLVFDGSQWKAAQAPVSAGAVNVEPEGGIVGDGTGNAPLEVAVSNTSDNRTDGLYTYIDTENKLRVQRPSSSSVSWSNILNKPTEFPPEPHTHTKASLGIHTGPTDPPASLGVNGDIYIKY